MMKNKLIALMKGKTVQTTNHARTSLYNSLLA